jgi:putative ABC transport system ATP-binding protein
VMEYLSEFHRDGRTIVMVTHDDDAALFACRTIRLVHGTAQEVESVMHREVA